jgi:hypothetical protein
MSIKITIGYGAVILKCYVKRTRESLAPVEDMRHVWRTHSRKIKIGECTVILHVK